MDKLKLGCCTNCDAQIMDLDQRDPSKRKLDNYAENWFYLSDGSLMKVGMCYNCNNTMDQSMADTIMDRHYATWEAEIAVSGWDDKKKQKSIDDHLSKKVTEFSVDQIQKINDIENEKNISILADKNEKIEQQQIMEDTEAISINSL